MSFPLTRINDEKQTKLNETLPSFRSTNTYKRDYSPLKSALQIEDELKEASINAIEYDLLNEVENDDIEQTLKKVNDFCKQSFFNSTKRSRSTAQYTSTFKKESTTSRTSPWLSTMRRTNRHFRVPIPKLNYYSPLRPDQATTNNSFLNQKQGMGTTDLLCEINEHGASVLPLLEDEPIINENVEGQLQSRFKKVSNKHLVRGAQMIHLLNQYYSGLKSKQGFSKKASLNYEVKIQSETQRNSVLENQQVSRKRQSSFQSQASMGGAKWSEKGQDFQQLQGNGAQEIQKVLFNMETVKPCLDSDFNGLPKMRMTPKKEKRGIFGTQFKQIARNNPYFKTFSQKYNENLKSQISDLQGESTMEIEKPLNRILDNNSELKKVQMDEEMEKTIQEQELGPIANKVAGLRQRHRTYGRWYVPPGKFEGLSKNELSRFGFKTNE